MDVLFSEKLQPDIDVARNNCTDTIQRVVQRFFTQLDQDGRLAMSIDIDQMKDSTEKH